ncbi:MAG: 2-dehydropantoate 2-reductase N-terminal domain-containing protein [Acidobacteriota bacterium]
MKTLIDGAGPIGQWLALRLSHSGADVTLLARGRTCDELARSGIRIVDGLTGARTPTLDELLDGDRQAEEVVDQEEVA